MAPSLTGTARDAHVVPFLQTKYSESQGAFSQDGHRVAYASNESGRNEVYIRSFTPPGSPGASAASRAKVSQDGGNSPVWRDNGRQLIFRSTSGGVMSAEITLTPNAVAARCSPSIGSKSLSSCVLAAPIVVQTGNRARLTLETVVERRQALLDGNDATEAGITSFVDFAHAADTDRFDDFVGPEFGTSREHESAAASPSAASSVSATNTTATSASSVFRSPGPAVPLCGGADRTPFLQRDQSHGIRDPTPKRAPFL